MKSTALKPVKDLLAYLARIPEITEFNIGHNIISRAVFTGLYRAVEEMIAAIKV